LYKEIKLNTGTKLEAASLPDATVAGYGMPSPWHLNGRMLYATKYP
jgi:hypothetical protein